MSLLDMLKIACEIASHRLWIPHGFRLIQLWLNIVETITYNPVYGIVLDVNDKSNNSVPGNMFQVEMFKFSISESALYKFLH